MKSANLLYLPKIFKKNHDGVFAQNFLQKWALEAKKELDFRWSSAYNSQNLEKLAMCTWTAAKSGMGAHHHNAHSMHGRVA